MFRFVHHSAVCAAAGPCPVAVLCIELCVAGRNGCFMFILERPERAPD